MKIVKKVLLMALSFVLVAAISVGATLAFLADTDSDVNVMTVGNVKIDQVEYERSDVEATVDAAIREFTQAKPLDPAVYADGYDFTDTVAVKLPALGVTVNLWDDISNEQDKFVFVKNTGMNKAYLRTWFAFELGDLSLDDWSKMFHINKNTTNWDWTTVGTAEIGGVQHAVVYATYKTALAAGALAAPSLLQYAMDETAGNETVASFNGSYDILVFSQAVQTTGFDSANAAFAKAFGVNMPWKGTMNGTTVNGSSVQFPTTAAELQAALDNAVPGTTICLAAGVDYGTVYMRPSANTEVTKVVDWIGNNYRYETYSCFEDLTIFGADGATIDAIEIEGGTYFNTEHSQSATYPIMLSLIELKNVVIDGVTFTGKGGYDPQGHGNALNVSGNNIKVSGLTLKNCVLDNDDNTARLLYKTESTTSVHNYTFEESAYTFVPSQKNITVTGCVFNGGYMGMELRETENLTITNNIFNGITSRDILIPVNSGCTYTGTITITGNISNMGQERFVRASGIGNATLIITDNTINGYLGADEDFIKVTDATGVVTVENNNITLGASTVADLKAALAAGGNVVLTDDVDAGGQVHVSNGSVLDGNGKTITVSSGAAAYESGLTVTEGTAKNIIVTGAYRGLGVGGSGASAMTGDVTYENVTVKGAVYGVNIGVGNGHKLTMINCTFGDWNSYSGLGSAEFVGCTFTAEGRYKACQRISANATFTYTDCEFAVDTYDATGYYLDSYGNGTIILENCTVGGVKVTAENVDDFFNISSKVTVIVN